LMSPQCMESPAEALERHAPSTRDYSGYANSINAAHPEDDRILHSRTTAPNRYQSPDKTGIESDIEPLCAPTRPVETVHERSASGQPTTAVQHYLNKTVPG
jgi:hypothetical protein